MQLAAPLPHAVQDRIRTAPPTPIDHAHLARYTMGNRALEIEVLELFAGQAPHTLADLRSADNAKSWHIAAHTLKGSARAVGAFGLADVAAEAEAAGHASAMRQALIDRLERSLASVCNYITGLDCKA